MKKSQMLTTQNENQSEASAYSSDEKVSKTSILNTQTEKVPAARKKNDKNAFLKYDYNALLRKKLNSMKFLYDHKDFGVSFSNALSKKKYLENSLENCYEDQNNDLTNVDFDIYQYKMLKSHIQTTVIIIRLKNLGRRHKYSVKRENIKG